MRYRLTLRVRVRIRFRVRVRDRVCFRFENLGVKKLRVKNLRVVKFLGLKIRFRKLSLKIGVKNFEFKNKRLKIKGLKIGVKNLSAMRHILLSS